MNWEAMGALGEIVGALAVIATLVYLSIQIRQSNRQESINAVKEAFTAFVDAYVAATEDESKAENFRAGINRFDELSAVQQAMFHSKMQALANGYYQVWTLHKNGVLVDEELFQRSRGLILNILRAPGTRSWWSQWKHMPPQTFINELDKLIHDPNSEIIPTNEDLNWFKPED